MKSGYYPTAMQRLLVGALCLAAISGCTVERPAPADDDAAAAKRAAFEASTTAFHQALRTDHADSLFMYVADDVVLMPPGESAVRGKNAMREWYAGFLSQYRTASLTLANREVFVSGEWGVELGSYEWGLTPAAGGTTFVDRGNYMQVWQQLPDGQWRFAREIWNSSAPAAGAATTQSSN